jgi:hypothetical protein
MHETATLHFDLSHLSAGQPFTLHAGSRRYELTPHTRHSLAQWRRDNAALALVPEGRSPEQPDLHASAMAPDSCLRARYGWSWWIPRSRSATCQTAPRGPSASPWPCGPGDTVLAWR